MIMVKALIANLGSTMQNRHVSVPVCIALACEAGKIWMPQYRNQFDATQKLFFSYALVAAGNTGPGQAQIASLQTQMNQTTSAIREDDKTLLPKQTLPSTQTGSTPKV